MMEFIQQLNFVSLGLEFIIWVQSLSLYAGIGFILYRWKLSLDLQRRTAKELPDSVIWFGGLSLLSLLLWGILFVPIIRILYMFFSFLNKLI